MLTRPYEGPVGGAGAPALGNPNQRERDLNLDDQSVNCTYNSVCVTQDKSATAQKSRNEIGRRCARLCSVTEGDGEFWLRHGNCRRAHLAGAPRSGHPHRTASKQRIDLLGVEKNPPKKRNVPRATGDTWQNNPPVSWSSGQAFPSPLASGGTAGAEVSTLRWAAQSGSFRRPLESKTSGSQTKCPVHLHVTE